MLTSSRRRSIRGFTLIEMMTVVVLVGILATLAVYGVRKYILSAKSSEAISMMASIKSAEEAFKAETFVYYDVSNTFDTANWYPTTTPGRMKVQWGPASPLGDRWKVLGVRPSGPVQFAYAVVATAPGGTPPTNLPTVVKKSADFGLPTTAPDWMYIAAAKADLGGIDGVYTVVLTHSMSSEIYVENEGE